MADRDLKDSGCSKIVKSSLPEKAPRRRSSTTLHKRDFEDGGEMAVLQQPAKSSLRDHMLKRRRALGLDEWQTQSSQAQHNLLALAEYQQADCIALYSPAHNETDTAAILAAALLAGKKVLYPAVRGHEMVLRRVEEIDSLTAGRFGILEPGPNGIDHAADKPDLVIVPGVVFDHSGHRIGYGKGFYDRFLHHPGRKAHLVGLCHDFQLIQGHIPAEHHDIKMEIIVTDKRVVHCRSNRSYRPGLI